MGKEHDELVALVVSKREEYLGNTGLFTRALRTRRYEIEKRYGRGSADIVIDVFTGQMRRGKKVKLEPLRAGLRQGVEIKTPGGEDVHTDCLGRVIIECKPDADDLGGAVRQIKKYRSREREKRSTDPCPECGTDLGSETFSREDLKLCNQCDTFWELFPRFWVGSVLCTFNNNIDPGWKRMLLNEDIRLLVLTKTGEVLFPK